MNPRMFLGLLASGVLAASSASAAGRYAVVMSGVTKGELNVTVEAPGARRTVFRFQDRGRGPDLTTLSQMDDQGLPLTLTVDGLDYRKMAVAERFAVEAGRAAWTSGADDGAAAAKGFYLPYQWSDEDMAALARALLKAPCNRLPLLPTGQARIGKVTRLGVESAGAETEATLYFITGVELQPIPIWLDPEHELFAAGGAWLGVIKAGFEAVRPDLIAAQEMALADAAKAQAGRLQRRPSSPVLIRNATVFDAERRILRPGMSVLVRGDRIAEVAPDAALRAPAGSEIVEAGGRVLLPGLWDMHVHLQGQADGVMALMAGITSVRDLGNDVDALKGLTDQFDNGALVGPWVLKAALIDGPGPLAGPTKFLVDTPQAMEQAVGALADLGYPQIKLYSSLRPDLVPTAVAAAHGRGLRVSGHVPAGMTLRQAVEAGYDEVQHANFWFLNFMSPEIVAQTNTPLRFMAVAEHGRELDLAGAPARDLIAMLAARRTVLDPTLVVFENMFTGVKGELAPWMAPWAERLPAASVRSGRGGGRATTPERAQAYAQSFSRMKQMLKALHDAGVPMVAGTDGGALQFSRELELYVEAGVPAAEVLYMATLGAARVMKQDGEVGSIAPGKRADLVLVDGDPLTRMGDVRRTRLVMKGGAIFDPAALAAAAGLAPAP